MNNWLKTDDRQVAPQETEVTTYITAGLDVTNLDFAGML
jgi:hypothetical protein